MGVSAKVKDKALTGPKRKGEMKRKGGLKMSQESSGYQITLKSGKVVVFREPKIGDEGMAMRMASTGGGGTEVNLSVGVQVLAEFARLLLVSIDGKALKGPEKENFEKLFTYAEWQQVKAFVSQLIGQDVEVPKPEMVSLKDLVDTQN